MTRPLCWAPPATVTTPPPPGLAITDGGPIPTSTGQILGWTTDGWAPDAPTTVHLLVTSPDGTDTDYAIAVVWVDGDYQLIDPTRADTFTTTPRRRPGHLPEVLMTTTPTHHTPTDATPALTADTRPPPWRRGPRGRCARR